MDGHSSLLPFWINREVVEKFADASLLVRGRLISRQGVVHGLRVHLGSRWLLFVLLLQRLLSLVLLLLLERLERLLLHHVDSRLLLLPRPANKLGTWEDGAWQLMIFKGNSKPTFNIPVDIGDLQI